MDEGFDDIVRKVKLQDGVGMRVQGGKESGRERQNSE